MGSVVPVESGARLAVALGLAVLAGSALPVGLAVLVGWALPVVPAVLVVSAVAAAVLVERAWAK